MPEMWRVARAVPRAGAGRRHPPRHPRHGARRHRHHHRRRDAARELLQPLRDRARGRRHRQPGHGHRRAPGATTPVPRVVGKIRRTRPGRVRDVQFLRAQHRPRRQDHAAGPVHDDAAGARTSSTATSKRWRWTSPPPSTRRRATCRRPAPTSSSSTSRGCATIPEAAKRYAVKAINRALEGITVPTVVHLCFGYAAVVPAQQADRLLLPAGARGQHRASRSRSRRRSRSSTSACSRAGRQEDHARRDRPRRPRRRDRRAGRRAHPRRARSTSRRDAHPGARLRHEIPAARRAFGKLKALADGAAIVRREIA